MFEPVHLYLQNAKPPIMISSRRLNLESLETRICLDGNVLATVDQIVGYEGNTAVFRGDHLANTVQIIQTSRNDYRALGVGFEGFDTTINGVDQIQLNNIQNFLFDMGDGDDFLFFNGDTGLNAPSEITIDGQVKFFGRGGGDNVLIEDTKIRDNLYANLGSGNNFFQLIDSRVNGETRVSSGKGKDFIGTFRSTLQGRVDLSLGQGNDTFWSGSDEAQLFGSRFVDEIAVRAGGGADEIRLDQSTFKDAVSIRTGAGKDHVIANHSRFQSDDELRIGTGKHQDRVALADSIIKNVSASVRLGEGQDSFEAIRIRDLGEDSGTPFILSAGGHRDRIKISESVLGREVKIYGNHGNDEFRVEGSRIGLKMSHNGSDYADHGQGGLSINGGLGADFSELEDLIVLKNSADDTLPKVSTEQITFENVRVEVGEVHEKITELLKQLRQLQDLQVTVEVRFINVSDSFFEKVGIDFDFDLKDQTGLINLKKQPGLPGIFDGTMELKPSKGLSYQINRFETANGQFGGFDPTAGLDLSFAILSDLETFFFIRAAQAEQQQQGLTLKVFPVLDLANQIIQLDVSPQPYYTSTN